MTSSASKNYHEVKLTANASSSMECIKLLADAHINPTERQVYQLYDNWRLVK